MDGTASSSLTGSTAPAAYSGVPYEAVMASIRSFGADMERERRRRFREGDPNRRLPTAGDYSRR